ETFLTLLTAQMRNQDPLNPQDSTEFVSQLASFSAVEQQIKSNETLEALLEQSSQSGFSDFANLVGRSVSIDGPAQFDGNPIALDQVVDSTALSPQLFVRNGSGVVVAQIPVVPGTPLSPWDGTTDAGQVAPPGEYSFTLTSLGPDGGAQSVGVPYVTRVSSITLDGDSVLLRNDQGTQFAPDAIRSVYDASAPSDPSAADPVVI
ncbi:MAG: flagellar hook capping FlgD N-terminal domain-containing protein, partial [Pseudomonadota bacterium]